MGFGRVHDDATVIGADPAVLASAFRAALRRAVSGVA
jgi:hypothetical protein